MNHIDLFDSRRELDLYFHVVRSNSQNWHNRDRLEHAMRHAVGGIKIAQKMLDKPELHEKFPGWVEVFNAYITKFECEVEKINGLMQSKPIDDHKPSETAPVSRNTEIRHYARGVNPINPRAAERHAQRAKNFYPFD